MPNERTLIEQLEAGNVDKLVELLGSHDGFEQAALRAYFGRDLHERLTLLAHRAAPQFPHGRPGRENVVFIPDFFGSGLTAWKGATAEPLWMSAAKLVDGAFGRLRLADDGASGLDSEYHIRPGGVLKIHYSEILLALTQHYNVFAFAYDWRKHPRLAATDLEASLTRWLGSARCFHIVTHGSGALVARAYLQQFEHRTSPTALGSPGSRILMLGPPNRGSHFATQMLTGTSEVQRTLAALDLRHSPSEIAEITRTFLGLYTLLPEPIEGADEPAPDLCDPTTYGDARVPAHHLEAARSFQESMAAERYASQMVIVLGSGQNTPCGIADPARLRGASPDDPDAAMAAYAFTTEGDGVVPITRGRIEGAHMLSIEERHDRLTSNPTILAALHPLLSGKPAAEGLSGLIDQASLTRAPSEGHWRGSVALDDRGKKLAQYLETQAQRLSRRDLDAIPETCITTEERELLHNMLPFVISPETSSVASASSTKASAKPLAPTIMIGIAAGSIADDKDLADVGQVDAIALGHYRDTPPDGPLAALDGVISKALDAAEPSPGSGIIAKLLSRGISGQEVGQILCLPDPRHSSATRLLLIAGMGPIGQFGGPEVARLAREVCFTAAVLHKKHLAMVVIGSGEGNLPLREAVSSILQGVADVQSARSRAALERITFVERDETRIRELREALEAEGKRLSDANRLRIILDTATVSELGPTKKSAEPMRANVQPQDTATRITIRQKDPETYLFSALTRDASIPEREREVDPALVEEANDGLVSAGTLREQREWGHVLGRLLLPPSFRNMVFAGQSVVFIVDPMTARIHWEMLASGGVSGGGAGLGKEKDVEAEKNAADTSTFLGTSRGLTRQLLTSRASPPQPYVPRERELRVLVVADPAPDAPLLGAKEEGAAVASLFERAAEFRTKGGNTQTVEVVSLFGADATRANVLKKLMSDSFDVLHFAGHCGRGADGHYGWIFHRDPLVQIRRQELAALERVPSFIFSNACESGITSGRPERRSVDMAPSFAESFFEGGVSNFVCTAWPIDDTAARTFAVTFYAALLGLSLDETQDPLDPASYSRSAASPETIQVAMERARKAIARKRRAWKEEPWAVENTGEDARTWGAYQHYGNPTFRLFRNE